MNARLATMHVFWHSRANAALDARNAELKIRTSNGVVGCAPVYERNGK